MGIEISVPLETLHGVKNISDEDRVKRVAIEDAVEETVQTLGK